MIICGSLLTTFEAVGEAKAKIGSSPKPKKSSLN